MSLRNSLLYPGIIFSASDMLKSNSLAGIHIIILDQDIHYWGYI